MLNVDAIRNKKGRKLVNKRKGKKKKLLNGIIEKCSSDYLARLKEERRKLKFLL